MHFIQDKIDRFCRKHPGFGIPNLMLYIAIANVAIYFIDSFSMGGVSLSSMLYFSRDAIFHGQIWRLFTFVLLPQGSGLLSTLLSAYFYYWIGQLLERQWGTAHFTVFYLGGVVLNILFGLLTGYASMYYVNMSLFFSFAMLWPDLQVLLFFIIPVKVKWIAWVDAAFFIWEIISYLLSGRLLMALLPVVAMLNFLIFFWDSIVGKLRRTGNTFQHRHSSQTINFKKATQSAYEKKGYLHKCAVCGKTDTDYPNMEFRYCSKCNGYFCYCSEHINDHVHIQ